MIDFQTIIVALIILAASFFIVRRGWSRLRAMNAKGEVCETGCGKCATNSVIQTKKSVVQISRLIKQKKT